MSSYWDSKSEAIGCLNSLYTFVLFLCSSTILMCLSVFYIVINFVRESWLSYLEKRFPDLEFVKKSTLRSVVDTHRNMGIITLLVTVKGNCDPQKIKRRLMEDIIEKRQSNGQYAYRHLRMSLTTRWGWYAWQKLLPFNMDNHLIFSGPFYRGRPISDSNVQECVSETVSKYLVPDLPPWQITVFRLLTLDKYYILIRFHHMLLSHEGIDLETLFTINKSKSDGGAHQVKIEGIDEDEDEDEEDNDIFTSTSNKRRSNPFQYLYKTPKALPTLFEQIYETFTNTWNEFLSIFDPTENPAILKKPGLKATLAVFVIVIVSVMKQLILHPTSSIKIISSGLTQKGLTWSLLFWSIYNTLNPLSLLGNFIRGMWNIVVSLIKLPLILACEFRSFCFMNDEKYSDTSYIRSFLSIWALVKDCIKESLYYCKLFYGGPRVVSWSNAVPLEKIQAIQDVTGASPSEILITATSASLRDFLVQYSLDVPDTLLTTARYFPQVINKTLTPCGSGILCLPLPIRNPFGVEYDPVTELRAVQQIILRARLKQPALYLASLSQLEFGILTQVMPSPILRLVLNFLSRRFPVILSEVAATDLDDNQKLFVWGQEVEDLMYWKPPQANICMSLTLMTFGNYVRLGVIADALLSPHHAIITSTFAQHVWELAAAAGVSSNYRNYSFVSDESDTPEASRSSRNSTVSSSSLDLDFDENNLNQDDSNHKYPLRKKLQFNIP
ncbi:hypothetical protein RUM43_004934 [Polyplax serrata]|uniref:O-acyltransferase WSD1 C-terminal domain-containing protein n=1 Tax=Polyplax serrata TaxID=468196 RepID=A0AAN8SCS0_POLSC